MYKIEESFDTIFNMGRTLYIAVHNLGRTVLSLYMKVVTAASTMEHWSQKEDGPSLVSLTIKILG